MVVSVTKDTNVNSYHFQHMDYQLKEKFTSKVWFAVSYWRFESCIHKFVDFVKTFKAINTVASKMVKTFHYQYSCQLYIGLLVYTHRTYLNPNTLACQSLPLPYLPYFSSCLSPKSLHFRSPSPFFAISYLQDTTQCHFQQRCQANWFSVTLY